MTQTNHSANDNGTLAEKAEQQLLLKPASEPTGTVDAKDLLHELQIHQIELEMQNEELLKTSAELEVTLQRYTDLYDYAPIAYFTLDTKSQIIRVNHAAARLLELTRHKLCQKRFVSFIEVTSQARFIEFLNKTLSTNKQSGKFTLNIQGRLTVIEIAANTDPLQQIFQLVITDITKRKQAEAELSNNKLLNQAILNSIAAEIAVLDHQGVILLVNDSWRRFGLENASLSNKLVAHDDLGTNYLAACKPAATSVSMDSARQAYDGIRAVLNGHLPNFNSEYPCDSPSHQRWFSMSVTPLRGAVQGGAVISHRNITDRKHAEQQLRIAAVAFDCQESIVVMNASLRILRVNPAFTKVTGYSEQEAKGKNIAFFRSDRHPAAFYEEIWDEVKRKGSWQGELWRRRKKNGDYPGLVTITAVSDEAGQVTHYVVNITDVTSSKLYEDQRLLNEEAHRNVLVREIHHRIKNNLQGITGLLNHFAETHPEISDPINQAISQVQSISVIHGIQGSSTTPSVRVCELTVAIAASIKNIWQKPVSLEIPEGWVPCIITESEAVPMALILNELICNAIKHGKEESVNITLSHEPCSDSIQLTIHNIGLIPTGFGLENPAIFGVGLELVTSLLPPVGVQLTWAQQDDIVVTTLSLYEPIIQR